MKKIFLGLFILLLPAISYADDNIVTNRKYSVHWNGMYIADLFADIKEGNLSAKIESYGLVKKVSKYSSQYNTKFIKNGDNYISQSYHNSFTQRRGDKVIDIKYNKKGEVISDVITPPDNRAKRPAVEDTLKNQAYDPLTAVLVAHKAIKDAVKKQENEFYIKIYDGRRLARLDFKIYGHEEIIINGKKRRVIEVSFKRAPIQGFTNNELKRMHKEEPDFTLYLDENDFLPIKAEAEAPIGNAMLLLEEIN